MKMEHQILQQPLRSVTRQYLCAQHLEDSVTSDALNNLHSLRLTKETIWNSSSATGCKENARTSQPWVAKATTSSATLGCQPAQPQHLLVPVRNKGDVQSHKPMRITVL